MANKKENVNQPLRNNEHQEQQHKTDIDRPIASILSLNTIAHTVGAAGVGAEASIIWGSEAVGIASGVMTLLILVISEIIPKVVGATYWREMALGATRIIRVLIIITYPWCCFRLVTRMVGSEKAQLSVSREEVQAMVDVGVEEGVFKAKETKAIRSFLKLGEVRAEQIMTPATVAATVREDMTLQEFYDATKSTCTPTAASPVYDEAEEYIKGYVLRADVLEELSEDHFAQRVGDLIRPHPDVPRRRTGVEHLGTDARKEGAHLGDYRRIWHDARTCDDGRRDRNDARRGNRGRKRRGRGHARHGARKMAVATTAAV